MKKILSIILSITIICASPLSALAADSSEDQLSQNVAVTEKEYNLEKKESPYIDSTTVEIEMGGDTYDSQQSQVKAVDLAVVRVSIMPMGNKVLADVFLTSVDGVRFTKVEGTARLYVNGSYVTSEDFEADPLLAVASLQAGTVLECSDGLKTGDRVTVYFDGSFDTKSHGSQDFYTSASIKVS